jgi:hypothetical protein
MSASEDQETGSELVRLIKPRALPAEAVEIVADENERAALAKRFGLASVKTLESSVKLSQTGAKTRVLGSFCADFVQFCAISAEEFPASVSETLDFRFVEASAGAAGEAEDEPIEIELSDEDCDEIEYAGDAFDLGEAIAQTLGLAIDPYAEGPGADAAREKAGITSDDAPSGALAEALAGLKRD